MKNPFQSAQFKELQREYYDLLKEAGFIDIEDTESPREMLRNWNQAKPGQISLEENREYHYMATHFLNIYEFKNEKQRAIWELHAEGYSLRDISRKLHSRGFTRVGKSSVHETIQGIAEMMLFRFRGRE